MLYFRTDSNVPLRSTVAEASQAIAEEVAPVHQPETSQQERATPQAESSASLQPAERPQLSTTGYS